MKKLIKRINFTSALLLALAATIFLAAGIIFLFKQI